MIKRSAILLLLLAFSSISLLMFSSYKSVPAKIAPVKEDAPVKCSGPCKKVSPPLQWNIISQTMFPSES